MAGSTSYMASLQPFLVLDKNQFRGPNAASALAEAQRQKCQVLVIDTVFVEIAGATSKGKDWKDQLEKDFRDWTAHPELLAVATGFGELLRLERDSDVSALSSLMDVAMTNVIQGVVNELAASGASGLAKYDSRMATQVARLTALDGMLDPAHNLRVLRNLMDVWWERGLWWSEDKDAALRLLKTEVQNGDAKAYDAIALAATSDSVLGAIEEAMVATNAGYTREAAKSLISVPSFTTFAWTARASLSLYYYALGRKSIDITNAERELNQTLDTVYLGFGLACRQLVTAENIVRRLDAGLRRALAMRWP